MKLNFPLFFHEKETSSFIKVVSESTFIIVTGATTLESGNKLSGVVVLKDAEDKDTLINKQKIQLLIEQDSGCTQMEFELNYDRILKQITDANSSL